MRSTLQTALVGVALAALQTWFPVLSVSAQSGVPFYDDVPAGELIMNQGLDPYPSSELATALLTTPGGGVCALASRGRQIIDWHSSDGGASFGPEQVIAGTPVSPDVFRIIAAAAPDGRLYAALRVAGPAGGYDLAVMSSADGGASWSQVRTLTVRGGPGHGVPYLTAGSNFAISAAAGGRAAIVWVSQVDSTIWVTATRDGGATWSAPTRALSPTFPGGVDIVVSPVNDTIHVIAALHIAGLANNAIIDSRSLDGGATFATPVVVHGSTDTFVDMGSPSMESLADGRLLVAFEIADLGEDAVAVFRTADDGLTWNQTFRESQSSAFSSVPVLRSRYDSDSVMLGYLASNTLYAQGSADGGTTFSSPFVLSDDVTFSPEPVEFVPVTGGAWVAAFTTFFTPTGGTQIRATVDAGSTWGPGRVASPGFSGHVAAPQGQSLLAVATTGVEGADRRANAVGVSRGDALTGGLTPGEVLPGNRADVSSYVQEIASAAVATSRLFVAFSAVDALWFNVFVRSSSDRGLTFGPPTRLTDFVVGGPAFLGSGLRVAAAPDGHVWVAYLEATPGVPGGALRVRHSADFGVAWDPPVTLFSSNFSSTLASAKFIAAPGGRLYVVWSDSASVFLTRTVDGGASFATADIDQDLDPRSTDPQACLGGERLFVAWREVSTFGTRSCRAAVSDDFGATFSAASAIAPAVTGTALQCSDQGTALFAFANYTTGNVSYGPAVARFDGSVWHPPLVLGLQSDLSRRVPSIAFTSTDGGDAAVLVPIRLQSGLSSLHLVRTSDGGASFAPAIRIDDGSPFPDALDVSAFIASDRAQHLWVVWSELGISPTGATIVSRGSSDGGQSWGTARRMDRKSPQGVYSNSLSTSAPPLALPDGLFLFWLGTRDRTSSEALFNSVDLRDEDRDGLPAGVDCDDQDSASCPNSPPVAVASVAGIVECTGNSRALVHLDGSASTDPDSTAGNEDIASWAWSEGGNPVAAGSAVDAPFALGLHTVVLTVTDRGGLQDDDTVSTSVVDTTPPSGGIAFPTQGSCYGPSAIPVIVQTAFADVCDSDLDVAFAPGSTQSYQSHGDHVVAVNASDGSGHSAHAETTFTIDLVRPEVAWQTPTGRPKLPKKHQALPLVISSRDEDAASGGVSREAIRLDGCLLYDGATHGDGDGLLSDETLALSQDDLCRVATNCGIDRLDDPLLSVEATDCAGNLTTASLRMKGKLKLDHKVCTTCPRPHPRSTPLPPASTDGRSLLGGL